MEQNKLNELCKFQDLAGYYVKKSKFILCTSILLLILRFFHGLLEKLDDKPGNLVLPS